MMGQVKENILLDWDRIVWASAPRLKMSSQWGKLLVACVSFFTASA